MVPLVPVGADIPAALQPILTSFYQAIAALQNPQAPSPLFSIDTAADLLARAPAEDYQGCFAQVADKACVAHSTLVSGTWTWLRADGGAL